MDQEFIRGTSGQKDYIVIAKDAKVTVGVKAVLELSMSNDIDNPVVVATGIRLRVVPNGTVVNLGHIAQSMFPKYKFAKVDKKRASAYNLAYLPVFKHQMPYVTFMSALENSNFSTVLNESIDYFYDVLADPLITKDQLNQYIQESFAINFNSVCAQIKSVEEYGEKVVTEDLTNTTGKVIDLKPINPDEEDPCQ